MPRYKLTLEYNGTPYHGWQKMPDAPTIQGELTAAIHAFCGERVEPVAAGRTDSGVHALGQVAHVDLQGNHTPFTLMSGINYHLQTQVQDDKPVYTPALERSISVVSAEVAEGDFHARFSAVRRHYRYRILARRSPPALNANEVWHVPEMLDLEAMQQAATFLIGTHDFTSFRDTKCQAKSAIKTMEKVRVEAHGEEIHMYLSAKSFLHHMVRNITGSLKLVGTGKWRVQDFQAALDARDRTKAGPTAPPQGLCFMRVDYEK